MVFLLQISTSEPCFNFHSSVYCQLCMRTQCLSFRTGGHATCSPRLGFKQLTWRMNKYILLGNNPWLFTLRLLHVSAPHVSVSKSTTCKDKQLCSDFEYLWGNWFGVVGIVTRLRVGWPRVSDLGKGKFFLLQNVQIGFEAHPAFCLTRNGVLTRV